MRLGSGGQWWINGDKKFGCDANKRGPGGSKGDTEGPCVSLPNHCVALWGTSGHGGDLRETKTDVRSYKEEGEVEEEERK